MTAFGAVAGMISLQAVIDSRYRDALLWLLAAQILDGLDGPIAPTITVSKCVGKSSRRTNNASGTSTQVM